MPSLGEPVQPGPPSILPGATSTSIVIGFPDMDFSPDHPVESFGISYGVKTDNDTWPYDYAAYPQLLVNASAKSFRLTVDLADTEYGVRINSHNTQGVSDWSPFSIAKPIEQGVLRFSTLQIGTFQLQTNLLVKNSELGV